MPPVPHEAAFGGLPEFDSLTADDVVPMTRALIERCTAAVAALEAIESPSFESLVVPFEELRHELARTWSPVSHLQMVSNNEAWQAAYLEALALLTAFQSELAQNALIYRAFDAIHEALGGDAPEAQRALLEHTLRDFRLAGVALADADKTRLRALQRELSEDQANFTSNLQRCTVVAGLPLTSSVIVSAVSAICSTTTTAKPKRLSP